MPELVTGKYRRGTYYTISFPTLPSLTLKPRRVELHQKQGHHDILTLEFTNTSPLWVELIKTGVPVRFDWTQNQRSNSWFGYVSFLSKTDVAQVENIMEVRCLGVTFPLKERATRVFNNSSITGAVKEIVSEFGFKFLGEEDGRVFTQLSMAGHSYWEWIQEQAKRIGYGVVIDGMTFCFRPLDKLINQGISSVPLLSMSSKATPMNGQFLDRTLDWFKVTNGEYVEESSALRTNKQIAGVDPVSGKIYLAEKSPDRTGQGIRENISDTLFNEPRYDQVVHDPLSAEYAAKGAASMARFNMPAKAKCQGDPRIRPFYPVLIKGTGPMTDGYWIVKEVKHMFARIGDYQIEMAVQIDGTGINAATTERQGTDTVVGMVNLVEAINNQGNNVNANTVDSVELTASRYVTNTKNQGFKRTPARWKYRAR